MPGPHIRYDTRAMCMDGYHTSGDARPLLINEQLKDALGNAYSVGQGVSIMDFARGYDLTAASTDYGQVHESLQLAGDAAIAAQVPLTLYSKFNSGNTYRMTEQLVYAADVHMIQGAGGATHSGKGTLLEWQSSASTWGLKLTSAAGATGNGSSPSGFLRGVTVSKAGTVGAASTFGVQLQGLRQFILDSVTVQNFDVNVDLIDNCFGFIMFNCRVPVSAGNIGINVRTGTQSGNDLYFLANWIAGKLAAMHVTGGTNNIHVEGGQYSAGQGKTADDDAYGVFTICKDYLTGTIAAMGNMSLNRVDFEGATRVHLLRTYGELNLSVENTTFLANGGPAQPCISLLKMETVAGSKMCFRNNRLTGVLGNAAAADISTTGMSSTFELIEDGWQSGSSTLAQNTSPAAQSAGWFKSIQEHITLNKGIAFSVAGGKHSILQDGVRTSGGNGTPEGSIVGNVGDSYNRRDGGANTTFYKKESGAATNTGWVAK